MAYFISIRINLLIRPLRNKKAINNLKTQYEGLPPTAVSGTVYDYKRYMEYAILCFLYKIK